MCAQRKCWSPFSCFPVLPATQLHFMLTPPPPPNLLQSDRFVYLDKYESLFSKKSLVCICLSPNGVRHRSCSHFMQLHVHDHLLPCVCHVCPSVPRVCAECRIVRLCGQMWRALSDTLTTLVLIMFRWEHGRILSRRVICCDLGSTRTTADALWM